MSDQAVETAGVRDLPPAGSVSADKLLALPEGSLVVTYGIGWAKTGPDEWRCPFKAHVPHRDIGQSRIFEWHDIRDSEWLSKVATLVVFNPKEWGL